MRQVIVIAVCFLVGCANCGENNAPLPEDTGTDASGNDASGEMGGDEEDLGGPDAGPEEDMGADAAADADMQTPQGYHDPTGASGTRLKRQYFEGGEGAYMTVDFWDTELQTACVFREAVDGAIRCLPPRDFAQQAKFADAGCSEPVYASSGDQCQRGWSRNLENDALYRTTDTPAVLSGELYTLTTTGECRRTSIGDDDDHFVAELVPSAEFVRGTNDDQARADGMVARYVDGEDGSRTLLETLHADYGYACQFGENGRCRPDGSRTAAPTRFTDAGCTDPIHGFWGDLEPPVIRVSQPTSEPCEREYRYYERGSVVTADPHYRLDDTGACVEVSPSSNYTYYRRGTEIPLATIPQATVAMEGTGELTARRWVDMDGAPLGQVHEFWDTTRDESCDPMELEDSSFACVSSEHARVDPFRFSDSDCSEESQLAADYCTSSTPRLTVDRRTGSCHIGGISLVSVHETGADHGEEHYFDNGVGGCRTRTARENLSLYEVGPAVTELPTVQLKTEME